MKLEMGSPAGTDSSSVIIGPEIWFRTDSDQNSDGKRSLRTFDDCTKGSPYRFNLDPFALWASLTLPVTVAPPKHG